MGAVAAATSAKVAVERTAVTKKRRHNRDPLKQPKKALKRRLGIVSEGEYRQGRQCQLFSR